MPTGYHISSHPLSARRDWEAGGSSGHQNRLRGNPPGSEISCLHHLPSERTLGNYLVRAFPHLQNGVSDNNSSSTGLMGRLSKLTCVKYLEYYLVQQEHSIDLGYYLQQHHQLVHPPQFYKREDWGPERQNISLRSHSWLEAEPGPGSNPILLSSIQIPPRSSSKQFLLQRRV